MTNCLYCVAMITIIYATVIMFFFYSVKLLRFTILHFQKCHAQGMSTYGSGFRNSVEHNGCEQLVWAAHLKQVRFSEWLSKTVKTVLTISVLLGERCESLQSTVNSTFLGTPTGKIANFLHLRKVANASWLLALLGLNSKQHAIATLTIFFFIWQKIVSGVCQNAKKS